MYFISMSRRVGFPSGIWKWGPATAGRAGRGGRAPRIGTWVGRCSGRIGPPPARIVARSIALASSRMLPGQSCAGSISIASGVSVELGQPAPRGVAGEHVLGQRRDVGLALAERGQVDLERVEPEEEVLAELVGVDHLAEVAVGRAEDADVDAERVVLADAADLARLEEPEQLDLHALVELADLVEEERAAVGDLEEPLAVGVGAGEGPLAVAEELALDEVLGQGAAVDRDERLAGAAGSCRAGCGRSAPCRCRSRPGS